MGWSCGGGVGGFPRLGWLWVDGYHGREMRSVEALEAFAESRSGLGSGFDVRGGGGSSAGTIRGNHIARGGGSGGSCE